MSGERVCLPSQCRQTDRSARQANIWIGNKFGRRTVLIAGGVGTLIGGALQAGSVDLAMLMASRLINGFAVGQLTATVPPYVAEMTKPRFRGTLMSIELVLAATGLMSAFWVTYAFRKETGELGWRIVGRLIHKKRTLLTPSIAFGHPSHARTHQSCVPDVLA